MAHKFSVFSIVSMLIGTIAMLNWGLYGAIHIDLVSMLLTGSTFGGYTIWSRIVYIVIGLFSIPSILALAYAISNIDIKKII